MNVKKKDWTPYRRVASELKRLLGKGPVMDGTLSSVDLGSSVRHAACSQTCRNLLRDVESEALEGVLAKLAGHMVRSKWFEEARLWGCLCVAVDGTLCSVRRGRLTRTRRM